LLRCRKAVKKLVRKALIGTTQEWSEEKLFGEPTNGPHSWPGTKVENERSSAKDGARSSLRCRTIEIRSCSVAVAASICFILHRQEDKKRL